ASPHWAPLGWSGRLRSPSRSSCRRPGTCPPPSSAGACSAGGGCAAWAGAAAQARSRGRPAAPPERARAGEPSTIGLDVATETAARRLVLDGRVIGDETDCFVIAEIGHNHQGSVEKAKELFRAARDCGVDAVKLQKRDNRSLFTRAAFDAPYDNENSFGPTYGLHREALELDRDAYAELQAYARG